MYKLRCHICGELMEERRNYANHEHWADLRDPNSFHHLGENEGVCALCHYKQMEIEFNKKNRAYARPIRALGG